MTSTCNANVIKERAIDEFVSKGKIIHPYYYKPDRASIAFGCSEECPYNTYGIRQTFVLDKPATERMVQRKGYVYCWDSCPITDCPAYQREHRDKD